MEKSLVKFNLLLAVLVLFTFSATASLEIDSEWVKAGDELAITVDNSSMNNDSSLAESFSVDIKSGSENDTVDVTETGQDTGVFEGSITVTSSDSDGELPVSHGDTITASYSDESGESQDTAEVDLNSPEFVSATMVSPRDIEVVLEDSDSGLDKDSINVSDFSLDISSYVESIDKSGVDDNSTDRQTVVLGLNESASIQEPSVDIKTEFGGVKDVAGNIEDDNALAVDEADPEVELALAEDRDADGNLDTVTLEMTESIQDFSSLEGFSVEDDNGDSIEVVSAASGGSSTEGGFPSSDRSVVIELQGESTTGPPNVEYAEEGSGAQIIDQSDNGNTLDKISSLTAVDRAEPVLLSAVVDSKRSDSSETYVKLDFSEPVEDQGDGDSNGVTIGQESIDFSDRGMSKTHSINYGSVLETGDNPTVSFSDDVEDDIGNSVLPYEHDNVEVDTFRKELKEGWNFVSFPIEKDTSYPVTEIFPETVTLVWTYQGGEWQNYDATTANNDFTEIRGGYGYLVKAESNHVLAPNVDNADSEGSSDASYELQEGWNLVGHFQEYNQSADTSGAFDNLNSGDIENLSVQDTEGQLSTTELSENHLRPGDAYWMYYEGQDNDNYMTSNMFSQPSNLLDPVTRLLERWFR